MDKLRQIFSSGKVQVGVLAIICLNAITLGLQTYPAIQSYAGRYLDIIDTCILIIFIIELACRILLEQKSFFSNAWNWFDTIIVLISCTPNMDVFSVFRILRMLRIVRLMRVFSLVPQLRVMMTAMVTSLPSLGWIMAMTMTFSLVFALVANGLYGSLFPEYFGDFFKSFYTMLEFLTRSGWNTTARKILEKAPSFYLFIVPYIIFAAYILMNFTVGAVVGAMRNAQEKINSENEKNDTVIETDSEQCKILRIMAELAALRDQVDELKKRELVG
ncbi:MAG: ion transporter [Bacillota bacterium]